MRTQIRVRVNAEQWQGLKQAGETDTQLCDRLLCEWQEQQSVLSALSEIASSPSEALGRLLASHELLSRATITVTAHPANEPPPLTASAEAPLVGGLENNSEDW